MSNPPPVPVPPKDTASTRSKRKRSLTLDSNDIHELRDGFTYVDDTSQPQHTPKRNKSHVDQDTSNPDSANISESDALSTSRYNGLRRKKGVNNLSNVNLRQEANSQQDISQPALPARESKFQEGSLKDRPSQKPPSAFTRFMRTDSGNIQQVDQLMEDYHDTSHSTSTPTAVDHNIATMDQDVDRINSHQPSEADPTTNSKSFFAWSDGFKLNFRPVQIWKRVWNDTKEDLARKTAEEAQRRKEAELAARLREEEERKAKQKEEAEERYAQMKASGQFKYTPVGEYRSKSTARADWNDYPPPPLHEPPPVPAHSTPHNSNDRKHTSIASAATSQLTLPNDTASRASSELPAQSFASSKTLKSRLSTTFRNKPSLFSIRSAFTSSADLKRVKSDYNLAASQAQHNRDSSTSLSPIKSETPAPDEMMPPLKPSISKPDLRRQNKLSKRVSDLEGKLHVARRELDDALVQASPMPKMRDSRLGERFTPTPGGTLRRGRSSRTFTPGGLPSLPIEGVLFGGRKMDGDARMSDAGAEGEPTLTESMIPSEFGLKGEDDDEATIRGRARAGHAYPPRASSLFFGLPTTATDKDGDTDIDSHNNDSDDAIDLTTALETTEPSDRFKTNGYDNEVQTSELTQFTSSQPHQQSLLKTQADNNITMDPNFDFNLDATHSASPESGVTIRSSSAAAESEANDTPVAATKTSNKTNGKGNGKGKTYATLDEKLKALDQQVKAAAKAKKPSRKRKSVGEEDKLYKPSRYGGGDGGGDSDEDEDEDETPRRKKAKRSPAAAKGKGKISPKISPVDSAKGAGKKGAKTAGTAAGKGKGEGRAQTTAHGALDPNSPSSAPLVDFFGYNGNNTNPNHNDTSVSGTVAINGEERGEVSMDAEMSGTELQPVAEDEAEDDTLIVDEAARQAKSDKQQALKRKRGGVYLASSPTKQDDDGGDDVFGIEGNGETVRVAKAARKGEGKGGMGMGLAEEMGGETIVVKQEALEQGRKVSKKEKMGKGRTEDYEWPEDVF